MVGKDEVGIRVRGVLLLRPWCFEQLLCERLSINYARFDCMPFAATSSISLIKAGARTGSSYVSSKKRVTTQLPLHIGE